MDGFSATWSLAIQMWHVATLSETVGVVLWFLSGVFLISGIAKLRRPDLAAAAIVSFGILSHPARRWGAAIATVELFLAAWLGAAATGVTLTMPVLIFATALLATFACLIARSLLRRDHFPCSCFGTAEETISRWTLIRTSTLLGLALAAAMSTPHRVPIESAPLTCVAGCACIGIAGLSAYVSRLTTWNRNPWKLGEGSIP